MPTLGDFIQSAMASSGQGSLIWVGQKDTQVTLANQDLVNTVTIARRPNFAQNGSNTLSLPALGSVTVDGSKSIWALAPVNTTPILILPGGGQWAPAPSQVAASINALGLMKDTTGQAINTTAGGTTTAVNGTLTGIPNNIATTGAPALSKSTLLTSGNNTVLAANGTLTLSTFSLNQPSFEFFLQAQYSTANGTNPYVYVVCNWFDSVTGLLIDKETFVTGVGNFSGNTIPTRIKGPSRGDQIQVKIYNLDPAQAIKFSYTLLVNSRFVFAEQIDWAVDDFENNITLPGHTLATFLPDSRTLGTFTNTALAASGTDSPVFPPHAGPAYINVWETGVSGANMQVSVQPVPNTIYGTNTPWLIRDVMAAGNPNKLAANFNLPNGPVQVNIQNGGSVAANYSVILVAGQTY